MKKGFRYFAVSMLLACLLILCTSQIAIAKADTQMQTLSASGGGVSTRDGDTERIEALTALIVMYSEQLEEYDRSNGSFVVGCVGFAGAVLGLVINMFISKKEKGKVKRPDYGMAVLFTLIPGIAALCLYVFSMQCRRVEFFRGYLSYLEEQLSQLIGIPMVFNSHVVGKFFREFNTMNVGFVVMGITVFLMFVVSAAFCFYFLTTFTFSKSKPQNENETPSQEAHHVDENEAPSQETPHANENEASAHKMRRRIATASIFVILVTFGISCCICVYDLCSNGDVAGRVHDFCTQFLT